MKAAFEKIGEPGRSFVVRRRADPQFEFCWHFHPEFELTWIVESRGQRFVGDSIERYGRGDLVLLGPNLPHTWMSDPATSGASGRTRSRHVALYAQFLPSFAGADFLDQPELASVTRLLQQAGRGLRFPARTASALATHLETLLDAQGLARLLKLLEILDRLAHARDAQPLCSAGFAPSLKQADERRIDAVCRYINDHFREPVSQPEAARRAHLSSSAFSRFFHKSLGKTFTEYVNELRVSEACRLLIESDKTVAEIAFAAGYENLSNFNRRFRELKRLSPREYRQRFHP